MEKSYHQSSSSSSRDSNNNNGNSSTSKQYPTDPYLKHLNKISHKISKPPINNTTSKIPPLHFQQQLQSQHHQQQQPPVYNINKSDFRDVVQKLTGSHYTPRPLPPPIQSPKPQSSRLQRIRPPPLANFSNNTRPPPPLNYSSFPNTTDNSALKSDSLGGSGAPLSLLPPFPSIHASAESPISAYMRYLESSTPTPAQNTLDFDCKRFPAPQSWNASNSNSNSNSFQLQQLPSPNFPIPPSSPFMVPHSALGLGRILSPRSPYPLLSPNSLFSPTMGHLGFPQFPQSPKLSVLSPRWRGV